MTWNLFIDDERNLKDVFWADWHIREKYRNEEWTIARNLFDAADAIKAKGSMPSFISFDHDLGSGQPTGYDIAHHLVQLDMSEQPYNLPDDFSFYVHSRNPVGKENIEKLLSNYLQYKKG